MSLLLKSFKTEIQPSENQKILINKTIGVCRFIKNFYISENTKAHKNKESFITSNDFQVWLNNEFIPNNPDFIWIKDVSTKSVKQALRDTNVAYIRYFKGISDAPTFKKKKHNDVSMYFVRNGKNYVIECERHRIKVPTLGWIKLKEKGYIPTSDTGLYIIKGNISIEAGRYYISVTIKYPDPIYENTNNTNEGIGIDLGIKDLAIVSNGNTYKNINKSNRVRKLEKQLRRSQRKLSRKHKNAKKGKATNYKNIHKQVEKIQKLHQRLTNIRNDYMNKVISEIVKTKPSYITIEDLNIAGMLKNKHLSKAIKDQKLSEFRRRLTWKCYLEGIELRVVSRWYPSSKKCNCCGKIKKDLKLSDRVYTCECGYTNDRDFNASLNLRDSTEFTIEYYKQDE